MYKKSKHPNFYSPNEWQCKAFLDKSNIVVLSGTAGSGKSRVAGEKINAFAMKYPGVSGLILRKAARELNNTVLIPFENQVLGRDTPVIRKKSESCYVYPNGSYIFYGGMFDEKERVKIRGIGAEGGIDFIWMDEFNAFSSDDFEEAMARLRGTRAPWKQLLGTTNPDSKGHWIYKNLIETEKASFYSTTWKDNPRLKETDYGQMLAQLSGVRYLRLAEGQWVSTEGAVYESFDTSIHMIEPFEIPFHWRRIRSIDFGLRNPFVCQWWAIDHDGRMYRYRELYGTEKIVADWAVLINALSGNEKYEDTICDHDAEGRATLERYGIMSRTAYKEILSGIEAVVSRLRIQKDGKPRIYLVRNAVKHVDQKLLSLKKPVCTEDEIPSYMYEKSIDGKPNKEEPIKKDDHGLDAMRYAVAYVDNLSNKDYSYIDVSHTISKRDDLFGDLFPGNPFLRK